MPKRKANSTINNESEHQDSTTTNVDLDEIKRKQQKIVNGIQILKNYLLD